MTNFVLVYTGGGMPEKVPGLTPGLPQAFKTEGCVRQ